MHGVVGTNEVNAMSAVLNELLVADTQRLWEAECTYEAHMVAEGRENVERQVEKAQKRRQVSHLKPYRKLTERLIKPLTEAIEEFIADSKLRRGVKHIAYQYLRSFPPETAALLTIQSAIDALSYYANDDDKAPGLNGISRRIGNRLQAEARMRAWKEENPGLWNTVQKGLTNDHATALHRQRVNTNRFNTLVRDDIGWVDWPENAVLHIGLKMIDLLVVSSGGRFFIDQTDGAASRNPKARKSGMYVLRCDDETSDHLIEAIDHVAEHSPVYMPTLIHPARWSNMRDGGYHSELLRGCRTMIRYKADIEENRNVALRELGHVDMPEVYDALNTIQEVGWRINRRVYEIATECWERDLGIAGLPKKAPPPKPPRPEQADTDPEVAKAWKRLASRWHGAKALNVGHALKASRSLRIAARYLDYEFFFPHALDFRGRMYPIPVDLQPQGQDLARGLLTFSKAKPVGENGGFWLAVHLANCWGMDKVSFEDRVAWVQKNEAMFMAIDSDPLKHRQWAKRKGVEHWQALAATFEWCRFLREGDDMLSSLPIRVDGTCNGIQHLSAMVRDSEGGASVNLVPGDKPRDIYREVAKLLEAHCRNLMEDGPPEDRADAGRWLEACRGSFERSLTKRPVMIFPYGGTQEAYAKYIRDWVDETDPDMLGSDDKEVKRLIRWMARQMWTVVGDKLEKPREVQRWLQKCARQAAKTGLPLRWVTPSGFVVRHFYGKRKKFKAQTIIDGQTFDIVDWRRTAEIDVEEAMKGIPPNFTHSMDASVLITTINCAWSNGVDSLTVIHDSFGTVAGDMGVLYDALRESFVWTYEHPVLEDFRLHCLDVIDKDMKLALAVPRPLPMGDLDLSAVRDSNYFFA